ncbi:hypothetical protein BXT84_11980 [Sulfobacillus thermotolerans]|uniref:Uncharacterized protein n=1 Tax=Sulfobacillus thermotolerans TaxID=338644 RepID=A0ABN5H1K9_9FIRM|nr:hypothetical protein BXT84_11980 [Sulfobacillus thermotolerans]
MPKGVDTSFPPRDVNNANVVSEQTRTHTIPLGCQDLVASAKPVRMEHLSLTLPWLELTPLVLRESAEQGMHSNAPRVHLDKAVSKHGFSTDHSKGAMASPFFAIIPTLFLLHSTAIALIL